MEIRAYTDDDYSMLCDWWVSWGWDCVPKECLSKNGLIVEKNGIPTYAGFLYSTDSNICLFELFISDKKGDRIFKKGGLDYLIKKGKEKAKEMGYSVIMCWVKEPNLMRTLRDNEIMPTDPDTTTFVGVI